ncbi:MAG: HD domain-containing protein, partial [Syntrophales bacterium]
TAGHQKRSADLARAIATEMGLPQEKINGIRIAGSIHDIGKLSIPVIYCPSRQNCLKSRRIEVSFTTMLSQMPV